MEENKEVCVFYVSSSNKVYCEIYKDYSKIRRIDPNLTESVVRKTISKSNLYGNKWTSNIFTSKQPYGVCYKYIIVYKDEWEGYSTIKRNNRLRKIGYKFKDKL